MKIKGKRGLDSEIIGKLLIMLAILFILLGGYLILRIKGYDALDYVKEILKFRR